LNAYGELDARGKSGIPGKEELRVFLDRKVMEYDRPSFITDDPVSIPHQFSKKQDIEIAGFFAAVFSWGNRRTIIQKSQQLMRLMDGAPHQFILHHTENDLRRLLDFKHRTFNATDLLYFVAFFQFHYRSYDSLEEAFLLPWEQRKGRGAAAESVAAVNGFATADGFAAADGSAVVDGGRGASFDAASALSAFHHYFFSLEDLSGGGPGAPLAPPRTRKHIATPEKNSSCKRINMFLRWMVRKDEKGVDFGIWNRISASRLICPLDLHVARVAKRFGLLTRERSDWQAALELTAHLRILDAEDPVKYDFALFGLGVMEKF
jgi:uncharacterized protein (TIGR02757 family)